MKFFKIIVLTILTTTPFISLAADANLGEFVDRFLSLLNAFIPVLFGVALLGFLWGASQIVFHAESAEKRAQGRKLLIWGIIGIFIMVSIWGFLNVLIQTFQFDTTF